MHVRLIHKPHLRFSKRMNRCIWIYVYMYVNMLTRALAHTYTPLQTHVHTHTHTHTRTYTHAHTHTHAHKHTHIHTRICTQRYTNPIIVTLMDVVEATIVSLDSYICIRISSCLYTLICLYIYLCTQIHTHTPQHRVPGRCVAVSCSVLQWFVVCCSVAYKDHFRTITNQVTFLKLRNHTCNILQHSAAFCNLMQHTTTCCTTFIIHQVILLKLRCRKQGCLKCCNTLQRTTTHRNPPEHTATHCNTLQHIATTNFRWWFWNSGAKNEGGNYTNGYFEIKEGAYPSLYVRCSVLQCVAVCCSVLQCAAVCCSVLQCVAIYS